MKRNILYTFIIATAMSMSGCSSFLEENPVDQMPEEEAYKNPQMIYLNTVANLYTKIGADGGGAGLAGTDRGLYDLNTFTADEAILPTRGGDWDDGGLWRNLFTHNWGTNNDLIIGTWDYLYGVIVQCNQSIDKLVSLKEQDPENEYYEIYRSEVRAIRAMYYYYLLDMFARVPIVESSLTQMADVKQSERTDVFNFVKKELEESIPLLEDAKSAENGEFYGRMTKAAAYFLMAKLALNAEVYTDNDWTDNVRPDGKNIKFTVDGQEMNCWEATVAYCDKVKACGYALNLGTNGFLSNFVVNNEGSKENIFVIPMDPSLYKARNMYLVRTLIGFDAEASEAMQKYPWPGNLRQLKNVVKRATLLAQGEFITAKDLGEEINERKTVCENPETEETFALHDEETEKHRILKALQQTGNNKTKAATLLGIDRKTLYNKLKLYHIPQ